MKQRAVWAVGFLLLLSLLLLAIYSSPALNKPEPTRIGVLLSNDSRLAKVEGLQAGLESLGYQPGQQVSYIIENAQNDLDKLPGLASSLIETDPDVLVAAGAIEAKTLQTLTTDKKMSVPVVFMGTLSPIGLGLVASNARPGGNLTGLDNYHQELTPKRLELLHRLLPNIHQVAVLGDTRVPFFAETEKNVEDTAKAFNLDIHMYTVSNSEEISRTLDEISAAHVEGILLLPGFFLETYTQQIVESALQKNIPTFGVYPEDAVQGCLASYGASFGDQGEQSAHIVAKILQGQAPGTIPIETPDRLIFSVNLKIAQRLNIHPPDSIISFADNVIQP